MTRAVVCLAALAIGCSSGGASRGTSYAQEPLPRCAATYRAECARCTAAGAPTGEWCAPLLEEHLTWSDHCAWIGESPAMPDGGMSEAPHAEELCALTELSVPSIAACYSQARFCPQAPAAPSLAGAEDTSAILASDPCARALADCARSRARPDPCAGLAGGVGTVCRFTSCAIAPHGPTHAVALLALVLLARRRR